jgi:acyl-CoA thioester hydrolase
MFSYDHKIRVRYGETDKMGYVYYGFYSLYYEEARTETMRQLGLTYRELEKDGIMMPVSKMNVKYIRPAMYDEVITVRTIIREQPTSRITFEYEIYNEARDLINIGTTELAFIHQSNLKPLRAPRELTDKLTQYLKEN